VSTYSYVDTILPSRYRGIKVSWPDGYGELGLAEQRVDLAVAHAVQHRGVPPAPSLGHQVVRIGLRGRDGAIAQRADRVVGSARGGDGGREGALALQSSDAAGHGVPV